MRWHVEYWLPSDSPLDIARLKLPVIDFRPLRDVPKFPWARRGEVAPWLALMKAFSSKTNPPDPPAVHENNWAPSGMEKMDGAFKWAIHQTKAEKADLWRLYYGAWLAGRGENINAINLLGESQVGVARALLARLLKAGGNMQAAATALAAIKEPWLRLHPQVVIERDKVLRNLGKQTLAERAGWLSQVDALQDEWLRERKVQLLIDQGHFQQAKDLLLSTRFQKVHQTYSRTGLWQQICKELHLPCNPVPEQLGEDRLANFGAYREFE
jgi:hypothetical protein